MVTQETHFPTYPEGAWRLTPDRYKAQQYDVLVNVWVARRRTLCVLMWKDDASLRLLTPLLMLVFAVAVALHNIQYTKDTIQQVPQRQFGSRSFMERSNIFVHPVYHFRIIYYTARVP